jgi:hypothetical protein
MKLKLYHLINYLRVNGFLLTLTAIQYYMIQSNMIFLLHFLSFVCRDVILLKVIDHYSNKREYISDGNKREENKKNQHHKSEIW